MKRCLAILVAGLVACNVDVGECWVRGQGPDGSGGGVIITPTGVGGFGMTQTGVGGFGQVPLEPQDAPDFADPCSSQTAECVVNWKAGSTICENQGTAGACWTKYQGQYGTLVEAKDGCERTYGVGKGSEAASCSSCQWVTGANGDPIEKCKRRCDRINEECIARCPKGDKGCMYRCNVDHGECLKDCER
jgi:hypothetical protein